MFLGRAWQAGKQGHLKKQIKEKLDRNNYKQTKLIFINVN